MTNICYLTVSVAQELGSGLAVWFWFRVFYKVAVKMSARAAAIWSLSGVGGWLTHMAFGMPFFFSSSLAVDKRPHFLGTWASPNSVAWVFSLNGRIRARQKSPLRLQYSIGHINWRFYKWQETTQGHEYQEAGTAGASLGGWIPQIWTGNS